MKTSNLFGILALGGIGYYFLKNKKSTPMASATPPSTTYTPPTNVQSQLVENPYATATKVDNSFYNTPVGTPKVNTNATINTAPSTITNWSGNNNMPTPIKADVSSVSTIKPTTTPTSTIKPSTTTVTSTPSVKIETALSPLGIVYPTGLPNLGNSGIPTVGWDFDGDLVNTLMNSGYGSDVRYLIFNPEIKEWRGTFMDESGNMYLKDWTHLPRDRSPEALKDGFHRGVLQSYSPYNPQTSSYTAIPYYVKNKMLYLLPSTLIQNFRNKYLVPLASYIKRLPQLSLTNATSQYYFDLYPKDGVWTIPPHANDGNTRPPGYVLTPLQLKEAMLRPYYLERAMKENSNQYSSIWLQKLVRNPQSRNYGTMYIDQFGNIIEAKTFSDRDTKGYFKVPAWELAKYRVDNNIPF
jgi:hypothetical protein